MAWPELENKHRTWELIKRLCGNLSIPIIFGEYFSKILPDDKKEGGVHREKWQIFVR